MAAMWRLLPVLRRAAPELRPHCRFLQHSPSLLDAVAASASPSPNLLSRGSGSLLPTSAGAVVAAARTASPRGSGFSELLSLQLSNGRALAWLRSAYTLFQCGTSLWSIWVYWRSNTRGPDGMVLVLVGANVAVYVLCRLADPSLKWNHFSIAVMFGPAFLLKLYLTGAVTGSAVFLADMAFLAPRKQGFRGWKDCTLGASGAVNAIFLLHIFLYPRQELYVQSFIPVPAALVGAYSIGADLWRIKKGRRRVASSTHLGGAFVAALVWTKLKGWF